MLSPDIRVQTESKKHRNSHATDTRKKSLIDSGIELLFKKNSKNVKDGGIIGQTSIKPIISHPLSNDFYHKYSTETTLVPSNLCDKDNSSGHGSSSTDEHHKWKLFDTIKIHTDKRKSIDSTGTHTI